MLFTIAAVLNLKKKTIHTKKIIKNINFYYEIYIYFYLKGIQYKSVLSVLQVRRHKSGSNITILNVVFWNNVIGRS